MIKNIADCFSSLQLMCPAIFHCSLLWVSDDTADQMESALVS